MSENILKIEADHYEEVVTKGKLVVLDFFSTECPPCEALASKYEDLAAVYGEDIAFVKIFRQGNRELADRLNVKSSPTLIFYRDGVELGERLTGGIKRADIVRNLASLLAPARADELAKSIPSVSTATDILILGAGPAGLAAAIYTAQAKVRTMVVDIALAGGQAGITHLVSNYPGFPKPVAGYELMERMREQAQTAGAEFRLAVDVDTIDLHNRTVLIDGTETITAKKIILALGTTPRLIGVPGEKENKGNGISYCATCDAKYFQDKHAVVIGGGNSAIEESLFIAKFASKVTIVHQFAELQANQTAQDRAFADPKIEFLFRHEPRAFISNGHGVDEVKIENLDTHETRSIKCDGVFIFAGLVPKTEKVKGMIDLDSEGYVVADKTCHTSLPYVFAVGDIVRKPYRQITTAVADGTVAAITATNELR